MQDFWWLNDASRKYLSQDYLLPGVGGEQRVGQLRDEAQRLLGGDTPFAREFGAKFYDYAAKGYYSFATPVWSNFGLDRGLPLSCYGVHISDSVESIVDAWAECMMQTKHGGGTSSYMGDIRCRGSGIQGGTGGDTHGSVHFARLFDLMMDVGSQGSARRGQWAGYWPIDHGDIDEVLTMHTENSPIKKASFGVTVRDAWLEDMIAGDGAKRKVWAKVLQHRGDTGYPYVLFIDNVNCQKPQVYKDHDLRIDQSNLCIEINLPNGPTESFVCCLSSMNAALYDHWKRTDAPAVLVFFLDAVISSFVERAKGRKYFDRTVRFAERHRALGMGWVGWHSLLQSKMLPVSSPEAYALNTQVATVIATWSEVASRTLAREFGEPELLRGYGLRNTTTRAIAPTTSSSFILGQVSPGIDPFRSNYYVRDLQKGKYVIKNPDLERLLESKGRNTRESWDSVMNADGSVLHLDFLSAEEKDVFRTFAEIDQTHLIRQAADRQKFIDQGQSLNLFFTPQTPVKDINRMMLEGWRLGVKSYYYQHSVNAAHAAACSMCAT